MRHQEYLPQSSRGGIAIVESRRFLRECLWRGVGTAMNVPCEGFDTMHALEADPDVHRFNIVILSWLEFEDEITTREYVALQRLRATFPHAAIVILAASQNAQLARFAIRNGARGYIPTSIGMDIVIDVLRFVLAGGTYAPPEIILSDSTTTNSVEIKAQHIFTPLELLIIRAIQQGKPNKVISYELNMLESAVKIYIRLLLRKLGAKNRTELAFRAHDSLGWTQDPQKQLD